MRLLALVLLAVLCGAGTARAAAAPAPVAELPGFPEALWLPEDIDPAITYVRGVPQLTLPASYVATLRARTEWARGQWLIEKQLRLDLSALYESNAAEVKATLIEGYEARLVLLRQYADGLEEKAKADSKTIDALRNPPVYKSKGFIYGLGVLSTVAAVVLGGVLVRR